jgi:protein gp37
MAEATKIQWTDHTFNPWIGCAKVSPACTHCYAEVDTPARSSRAIGLELWGPKAKRRLTTAAVWAMPMRWERLAVKEGRRHLVFCASQADIFESYGEQMVNHKDKPLWFDARKYSNDPPVASDTRPGDNWSPYTMVEARADLFSLIERTPHLTWQLLTKRPENMNRYAPQSWGHGWPRNVWAMTSVENQEYADRRIPELCKVPAVVRGLSIEPLLGSINFEPNIHNLHGKIHWAILGGESGPYARPCPVDELRWIKQQCEDAAVAVFVKQVGSKPIDAIDRGDTWPNGYSQRAGDNHVEIHQRDRKGGDLEEWPEDLRVREFPS